MSPELNTPSPLAELAAALGRVHTSVAELVTAEAAGSTNGASASLIPTSRDALVVVLGLEACLAGAQPAAKNGRDALRDSLRRLFGFNELETQELTAERVRRLGGLKTDMEQMVKEFRLAGESAVGLSKKENRDRVRLWEKFLRVVEGYEDHLRHGIQFTAEERFGLAKLCAELDSLGKPEPPATESRSINL